MPGLGGDPGPEAASLLRGLPSSLHGRVEGRDDRDSNADDYGWNGGERREYRGCDLEQESLAEEVDGPLAIPYPSTEE